jgi:hypothetical protein
MFLKELLPNINFTSSINCDSSGALALLLSGLPTSRTKHIRIRFNYMREIIDLYKTNLIKIAGISNPADILTKSISIGGFQNHVNTLLGRV